MAQPGRPPESKTTKATADVHLSRCPNCQSTERTEYTNPNEQFYPHTHEGKTYTHIIKRRTTCKNCGQARIDRARGNRVVGMPPSEAEPIDPEARETD